jgi:hypothetical protein
MAGEWPSLVNAFSEFIEHVRPRPRPSIHPPPPPPPRTALVASGRAAEQAEVGLAHVRARLDIAQARYSDVLEYLGENPKTENCDALGQVRVSSPAVEQRSVRVRPRACRRAQCERLLVGGAGAGRRPRSAAGWAALGSWRSRCCTVS